MKRFLKIAGITVLTLVIIIYCAFLFVLPNAVDLNQFKPEIQKIITEQTNLTLDFDNPKISVTPLLAAGVTADNLKIKLPDDSVLLSADNLKFRISLPSLLLLTVRVSTAEVYNPQLNIDIVDGKAFKAVQAYEEILNMQEENIEDAIQTAEKPVIDPSLIRIVVPAFKLINYSASVNDLKAKNFLKLKGDELVLGYRNGKTASVKTAAELFINDTKNINADINIDTFLPPVSQLDEEDDKAQRVEIPFVNPVEMYMDYDLKTNVEAKIKIRQRNNKIVSRGYFNVDNFTLKLGKMQLPESKFHILTHGTKVNLDTDLYITDEEKVSLLGMFKYGKRPVLDMNIRSNEIHLENVITLIKATLNSLHIKNELSPIHGEGYFIAGANIKTNFKKLKSEGNISVKNCIVKDTAKNYKIARANSVISLDNSILKFVDTSLEVVDTLFKIDGTIDETSNADISVIMEKMPVQKVFSVFLPSEINRAYNVNSGYINLAAYIKGELKKAAGSFNLSVNNLSLTDKVNKINYLNNTLTADFDSDFKNVTGQINNSGFKLTLNGASVGCDKFTLNLGEKDITIDPSVISINNASNINFEGSITDYIKKPLINFDANGKVRTQDLKQILGPDLAVFIKDKGAIPVSLNITGNSKKQTLTASVEADSNNYITPVDINNVLNKNTILQAVVDFKGDRLKIKDTGFFIKTVSQDPENPEKTIVKLDDVVKIDGTITKLNSSNPNINLLKVKIPADLSAVICAFPQSKVFANGNLYVFGDLSSPRIRGGFNIWDLSIPELMLTMEKAAAKFEGKILTVNAENIRANGSDYNILIDADLTPAQYFTIRNLDVNSNLTDVDRLMKVSDAAMKYVPASSSSSSSASADIPVVIKDGNIDIKQIKTGDIVLTNTTGKISLLNNVFFVNNLITSAFKGRISGDVSMNLISSEMKAVIQGSGLDVEQTLMDAAAMKDTLTGTLDFDTDISLKGAAYEEQMKSLKGQVNFTMKNGTLGPFGKLENLILAENIRESAFFQSTIGSVLNSLLSFDTSHFNTLNGTLNFADGIVNINPISSQGDIMATHIFGDFDLLENQIDIKLRGRLGSQVSDSLGPLALLNPVNLVKATPGMSLVLGKIFFLFTEQITQDEIDQIPDLDKDISDTNTTKFQVVVRGDVAKPLTLVKSFKWLALESEIESAQAYLDSIPEDTVPDDIFGTEQTEQLQEQAQAKGFINKIKSLFKNKEEVKESVTEQAQQIIEDSVEETSNSVEETLIRE